MIIPSGRPANNRSHPKTTNKTAHFGVPFLFFEPLNSLFEFLQVSISLIRSYLKNINSAKMPSVLLCGFATLRDILSLSQRRKAAKMKAKYF